MPTSSTSWSVPPWAWVPVGAAIVAEAVSNALRAYGLGAHLDHFTVSVDGHTVSIAGSVLVFAAVAISLSQARAAWVALTPNPLRQRIVAGLAAALLLAVSATAMVSHILEAQRAKGADEGGARSAYDRADAAYQRAAAELEALGAPRPVSVIQEEVRSFPIDMRIWRRSSQCEDISREDTRAACEPILALYKERGAAARKTELEPEVARLREELARQPRLKAATAEEVAIGGWWAWMMGAAVVFVATFGPVIFASAEVSGAYRPKRSQSSELWPDCPEHRNDLKGAVLMHIHTELAAGRSVPSNVALVSLFGGKRSTISDWLNDWEREGLIPIRRTVGRCKAIRPE